MNETLILALSFAGIFSLVGIVCIIGGTIMRKKVRELQQRCSVIGEAEIVDILEEHSYHNSENGSTTFHIPIYEYTIGDRKIKKRSIYGSQKYKKGQKIEIYYNPENPSDSYIKGLENTDTGMANGLITIGIIIIIVGIYLGTSIFNDK